MVGHISGFVVGATAARFILMVDASDQPTALATVNRDRHRTDIRND
ncbi:MAG: hypothetical protein JWM95_1628 [Gemmatimonadetes bacterium]|nr:hypothetical protein [Gemmatimonadota bacterium]